jgi:hypothetical protein
VVKCNVVWIFAAALGAACSGTTPEDAGATTIPDGGPIDCWAARSAANQITSTHAATFAGPCTVNDDCVVDFGSMQCPEGHGIEVGELAIAASRVQELAKARETAYTDFCATECMLREDAFYKSAYCREGTCRGNDRDPAQFCPDQLRYISDGFEEVADELATGCVDDEDCISYKPEVTCLDFGHVWTACPLPVAAINTAAAEDRTQIWNEMLCKDQGFVCEEAAECAGAANTQCVGFRCTLVSVEDADAGAGR